MENQIKMNNEKWIKYASYASVSVAAILIILKSLAWFQTNSISILAALTDSVMDILASIVNLFAIRYALKPADNDHRFGHGKAESLAGLGQSLFIAGSAIYLLYNSVLRFSNPQEIHSEPIGMLVAAISFVLTLALLLFQRKVVKQTGSQAIQSDALHYFSDLMASVAIFASLLFSSFSIEWVDPIVGIAIGLYILHSAWEIAETSIDILLDRELSDDIHEQILSIAKNYPDVRGVHALKTRKSGIKYFIQFHIEIDGDLPLKDAHKVSDDLENEIEASFDSAEVIIHQDPVEV